MRNFFYKNAGNDYNLCCKRANEFIQAVKIENEFFNESLIHTRVGLQNNG